MPELAGLATASRIRLSLRLAPPPPVGKDSSNLDALRALAVLSVFGAHLCTVLHLGSPTVLNGFGQGGVMLFFVHTSLVLMLSLERLCLSGWKLFGCFYIRRFFRIYPLSVAAVCLMLLLSIPPSPGQRYAWLGWGHVFSNLGLTQNLTYSPLALAPLWSLPLEVQMYVLLPALFCWVRSRGAGAVLLAWTAAIGLAFLQPQLIGRASLAQYAPCFLAGLLAYRFRPELRLPAWAWAPFVVLAVSVYAAFSVNRIHWGWLLCLALGAAVPCFAPLRSAWLCRPAHLVAKYSYGIYLSHVPILWLAFVYLEAPAAVRWGVLAALGAAVPVFAYRLLEQPGIRLGCRLAARYAARG